MNQSKYTVITDDPHLYLFFSEGPRGTITKAVLYSQVEENLFNLGFGNWNEKLREVDDSTRSNNGDRDKILATVAFTTLDFTNQFPNALIVAEGSTPARTRLYQMGIASNLMEINEIFEIYGFLAGRTERFERGRNYEAFLIKRK
jgi:hypothetical protein